MRFINSGGIMRSHESGTGTVIIGAVVTIIGLGITIGILQTDNKLASIFGLIFVMIGVVLIATKKSINFEANGSTRTVTIVTKGWKSSATISKSFDEVSGVHVETEERLEIESSGAGSTAKRREVIRYYDHLNLNFTDGTQYELDSAQHQTGIGLHLGTSNLRTSGAELAMLLGKPFRDIGAQPFAANQAIQSVISAVTGQSPTIIPITPPAVSPSTTATPPVAALTPGDEAGFAAIAVTSAITTPVPTPTPVDTAKDVASISPTDSAR